MEPLAYLGRILVLVGIVSVLAGIVLIFADRIPLIGRLPGDVLFRGKGWTVYIPITTGILLSLLATIVLNLFFRR